MNILTKKMAFPSLILSLTFYSLSLGLGPVQAQDVANLKDNKEDKELSRQLTEIEKQFPLAAKAFGFQQYLPLYCRVEEECAARLQEFCLDDGLPPGFCLKEAQRACCIPPPVILEPLENRN